LCWQTNESSGTVNGVHSSLGGLTEVSGINHWSGEELVDVLQTSTE